MSRANILLQPSMLLSICASLRQSVKERKEMPEIDIRRLCEKDLDRVTELEKEAFGTELSNLYTTLRSNGAWNSANIIAKWDNY
jgi:hypothetical protein